MNLSLFPVFMAFMERYRSHAKGQKVNNSRTPQQSKLQMVPSTMAETWANMSSTIATLTFAWAIICQYAPYELRGLIDDLRQKIKDYFNPYIKISIHEFANGDRLKRSEAYAAVEAYLSSNTSQSANRLRAEMESDHSDGGGSLVLSMDDYQKVTDEFHGIKLWWGSRRVVEPPRSVMYNEQGRRFYVLTFQKRYREIVTTSYLEHVMKKGKEIRLRNRQRRLYTNCAGYNKFSNGLWSHIAFEHPASFETMAMDPDKKREIVKDLLAFRENREFYERAGKAWKRGYLLYGPPGTGKSTMVAAMANLLSYDVYDLELTSVKDNTELKRLLIETTSKSIIVIEDIDCSLDLTGQREKQEEKSCLEGENDKKEKKKVKQEEGSSKVTLSGLLNFIDGIWSACGSERLIVFTTNYVHKLDPALIRRGRMDKHIELSYCSFEGFKVLAKNYLNLENHQMFNKIQSLMGETNMTPADVAENLVPTSPQDDPETYLLNLIQALEEAKDAAAKKKAKELKEIEPTMKNETSSSR